MNYNLINLCIDPISPGRMISGIPDFFQGRTDCVLRIMPATPLETPQTNPIFYSSATDVATLYTT